MSGADANPAVTYAMAGYALFVFAGLAFALEWLGQQDFAPGYWDYTFGLATFGQGLMLMAERNYNVVLETVAGLAFAVTLVLVLYVAWGSVRFLARGGYFPAAMAPLAVRAS